MALIRGQKCVKLVKKHDNHFYVVIWMNDNFSFCLT